MRKFLILLVPAILISCYPSTKITMKHGVFHLEGISSPFDDYNMSEPPTFNFDGNVIFSTNRASSGDNFDVWSGFIKLQFGYFSDYSIKIDSNASGAFQHKECNTDFNEYGPIIFSSQKDVSNNTIYEANIYLFASDRESNKRLNIYFYDGKKLKLFGGNDLNADDAYPVYDYETNILYFCSNRTGSNGYDIYYYENLNTDKLDFKSWLSTPISTSDIKKLDIVNSTGNDKFPYIFGKYMVFSSDREGGIGGYDIYYTQKDSNGWQTPDNINNVIKTYEPEKFDQQYCEKINTEEDEFRPSLCDSRDKYFNHSSTAVSNNKILIFSSNRTSLRNPGNLKGGVDLFLSIMPVGF